MKQGRLITFEGVEGSGKSTQIRLLQDYFSQINQPFLATKEPGGTPLGVELRRILLDKRYQFHSLYTEILFFTIDRLEHIEQVIKPALTQGKWVLCDRFIDSTIAYQEAGRQVPEEFVAKLLDLVALKPDITILLDIDPEIGIKRIRNRLTKNAMMEESLHDRFEHELISFHKKVRARYLLQAQKEPDRIKTISVDTLHQKEVFEKIIRELAC